MLWLLLFISRYSLPLYASKLDLVKHSSLCVWVADLLSLLFASPHGMQVVVGGRISCIAVQVVAIGVAV